MPAHNPLLATQESAAFSVISRYLAQTLVSIQSKHPEWIAEKYRKTQWAKPDFQSILIFKFTKSFRLAKDVDSILLTAKKYLQILLIPEFINSAQFTKLIAKIQQLAEAPIATAKSNHSAPSKPPTPTVPTPSLGVGIAILLLDVENLQLNLETEKFLEGICQYPIQIKVAFANWRSMGKKDAEFHQRGYQLIHVPPGKDSADLKMATVGASIFVHYPTAKEIFVCSSDRALTHLSNTLQAHGLTVFQVRKQVDKIIVLNSKTGQTETYSLVSVTEPDPIEKLIFNLKTIIKIEQERTSAQWVKLSRISVLFKENYGSPLNQVVATHLLGTKTRDIFIKYPTEFVVHQPSETSQAYVTLFEVKQSPKPPIINKDSSPNSMEVSASLASINSLEDLETAIVQIVKDLTRNSPANSVFLSNVGSEFHRQYGKQITQIIKEFNLSRKFPKFLQSCTSLQIQKVDKGWQVSLK
ncbi:MAG: NYN domain-containing protein [Oscillatoriales cyanobacterium]|uniref:NYN domain-containing protein n=1 Tax=Microcoleus anatoxicus PTRS2 TaxID=2705321 RepID=A0ABU8YUF9_9CYAN|nr:MAG: NYN domain-containing protein [Oscillatoriales cyanobacterium]TAE01516.1 MAG: NYN domain-containing protein [Oscillatoriales cyanobacterium]TAE04140.1 MAG: NYN domain-containing protein [Oscillatoriales cyanobacterium]TAF00970.1 MAG: NYN domain-containing protein [Oscillatoriales cyanobacterium]TAF46019.1 MAG: NYN domain-containing protein [Oscillatoriales cyanobacterium]